MKAATMDIRVALATRDICKHFPGVQALDHVSLELREGEIHALVGANGAGKSTLINILSGYFPPDSGQILLNGVPETFHSSGESLRKGIATVHQEIDIAGGLTVAQNIFLGNERTFTRFGLIRRRQMNEAAACALGQLGIQIDPATPVRRLSTGGQQLVMIASALVRKAKVMIFDEPTSALSGHEIDNLFRQIKELKNSGVSVIYISHYLDDICDIADRATVLRDGKMVGVLDLKECGKLDLIRLMIGHDVKEASKTRSWASSEEILRVSDLSTRDGKVSGVSFRLNRGEILGLFGAIGAGRSELAKAIFTGDRLAAGAVYLRGDEDLQLGCERSPGERNRLFSRGSKGRGPAS